ncbi:MAG: S4 domain-containing protein [Oscillospiraceae bacterium]
MTERIQKLLAAAGLCSRRTAEEWIAAGRVTVNGRRVHVGDKADPETDDIRVDGRPLRGAAQHVYLMLHKPRGYVTTLSDERGRPTAASLVRGCGARVYPVGRLDLDSEGLLLFTNDGALTHALLHPSH